MFFLGFTSYVQLTLALAVSSCLGMGVVTELLGCFGLDYQLRVWAWASSIGRRGCSIEQQGGRHAVLEWFQIVWWPTQSSNLYSLGHQISGGAI